MTYLDTLSEHMNHLATHVNHLVANRGKYLGQVQSAMSSLWIVLYPLLGQLYHFSREMLISAMCFSIKTFYFLKSKVYPAAETTHRTSDGYVHMNKHTNSVFGDLDKLAEDLVHNREDEGEEVEGDD
jgi:hypothetical protein